MFNCILTFGSVEEILQNHRTIQMKAKQCFPVMLLITMVEVVLGFDSVVVFRILSLLFALRLKSEGIFFKIQIRKKYLTF